MILEKNDLDTGISCLKAGATDVISKSNPEKIARRLKELLASVSDHGGISSEASSSSQKLTAIQPGSPQPGNGGAFYRLTHHADGTVRTDFVSESFASLIGYDQEDGSSLHDVFVRLIDETDRSAYDRYFNESIQALTPFTLDLQIRVASGKSEWLRVSTCFSRNPAGETISDTVLVNISSIRRIETELKRLNAELVRHIENQSQELSDALRKQQLTKQQIRQQVEFFYKMNEHSGDLTVIVDKEGSIKYQNNAVAHILGFMPEERVGQSVFGLIHPDDLSFVKYIFTKHRDLPGAIPRAEFRLRHKNGSWVYVEATGNNLLDDEAINGIMFVAWNITERKLAEIKLHESQALLDSVLNTAAIAICLSDENGRFVDANPFCCRMFGYTREEIIDKDFTMLLPPEQHEVAAFAYRTFISEVIYKSTEQWKGLCKDGTVKDLYTTAGIFKDAEMRRFIVLTFTDITERKKGQLVLQEANEKLELRYAERTIELQETNLLLKQKIEALTKTEAELRENSEKFRLTFDQSSTGAAIISLDLRYINVNRAFCKIVGYAPSELHALHLSDIAHCDDFEKLLQIFKRTETGNVYFPELCTSRFIHKDGQVVWCRVTAGLVKDQKSNPLYYLMQVADISEQKQIEATLQDREKQFENIVDGISGCVFRVSYNKDGRLSVLFISEGIKQLTGIDADEYVQNPKLFFDTLHPDERDGLIRKTMESFDKQIPLTLESRIICRNGQIKWVRESVRFYKEENGDVIADGLALDITDMKEVEQALKQSENDYKGLFEHAHDPIIIFEPESERVLEVNRRACTLYGYSHEEFLNVSMIDVSKYPARGKLYIKEVLKKGHYIGFETIHSRKDGTELILEINSAVISYKGSTAILSINHDVSERKHIENALRQSKRRYERIVNTALEGVWQLRGDMSTEYVNQQMADLLGYTPDELSEVNIFKHIVPEDHPKLSDWFSLPKKGHKNRYDIRFIRKNRSIIWALVSTTQRYDQHGDYAGSLFMVTDITDRKRIEDVLRDSERRYRTLAQNFPNGVAMTIDRDYRCILAEGDAFKKIGPDARSKAEGKLNDDLQPTEIAEKFRSYYEAAFEGQRQFFEISHAGREWEAYVVPNVDTDGKIETLTVIGHDITHRIKIENELRYRIELEGIINRISTRLINLPASEVDTAINKGIEQITNFIGAEEATVYKFDDEYKAGILTHRYTKRDNPEPLDAISVLKAETFRPIVETLQQFESIIVNDVELFSGNFLSAKNAIRQHGVSSFIVIPIGVQGVLTSALIFLSSKPSESWTKEVMHLLEIFKDIVANTLDRKQAEEVLQKSEQNYREIFNATSEAIFLHDAATGRVLDVNEATLRMLGYESKEEILDGTVGGLSISVNEPPYTKEDAFRHIRLAVEQGPQIFEWLTRHKNGEQLWMEVSLRSTEIGGKGRVLAVVRDITERKHMEDALRETTIQLETTVKAGRVGLWGWDLKANNSYHSAECRRQLGYEDDEIGDSVEDWEHLIHPDDLKPSWDKAKNFVASNQSAFEVEMRMRHKDGTYRWILVQASTVRDEAGNALRLMGAQMDITERKRVQDALRESEERFRLVFYTSPEAITINRLEDGLCVDINDSFTQMTGYTREDAIGKTVADVNIWHNPEDRKEAVRRMKETGRCQNLEVRFRRKDGSIFIGSFSTSMICLNGQQHLISTTRDVTEQHLAQDALRENEERLRIISELITDYVYYGTVEANKVSQTIWVVGAFEKITGYTVQEVNALPAGWLSVIHSDDLPMFPSASSVTPLQGIYEYRIITKSGQIRWLRDHLMPVSNENENGVVRLYGGVKDISEHKKAERALVKSEAMHRQSIEQTPHPVFTVDKQGYIRTWNQSCTDFLGYSFAEISSRKWETLLQNRDDCDKVRAMIVNVMQGQQPEIIKVSYRCKDGQDRPMSLYLYPMPDDGGKVDMLVFASADIDRHNQAE
ncbi:MAG: PAS domain S-box protein [Chlorobiales bacterium]|nr:PAS domain S-box protein [Chlorobiales bacterium]